MESKKSWIFCGAPAGAEGGAGEEGAGGADDVEAVVAAAAEGRVNIRRNRQEITHDLAMVF